MTTIESNFAYELDYAKEYQHLILTFEEEDRVELEFENRVPRCGEATGDVNEFFRICERIRYEIFNNGGGNNKEMECRLMESKMKSGFIPESLHPHVRMIIRFLRNRYNGDDLEEFQYEMVMAFSCELTRFALTQLD